MLLRIASLLPVVYLVTASLSSTEVGAWRRGRDRDFPYSDLISKATSVCYNKLVHNPSCCLDRAHGNNVTRFVVRRPGTEWECDAHCYDKLKGRRGDDVVWVPDGATCSTPRLLYIHGGSWQYGSPKNLGYAELGSKLAELTGAVVMLHDYPLIISKGQLGNYSSIMKASLAALQWLATHGPEGLSCPDAAPPLFVGGDSAGGGTALSLLIRLKKNPSLLQGRSMAGGFFYSPWTNLMCDTPEYYFNAFAKIVDTKSFRNKDQGIAYVGDIMFQGHPNQNLDWFTSNARGYVGRARGLMNDPEASPFFAGRDELEGLPPLYFVVGGSESILGDSVVVAQKAAAYGVDVHLDVYAGMWHVFPMYSEGCGGPEELWQAKRALNLTAKFVRHIAETSRPLFAHRGVLPPELGGGKLPYTVMNYNPNVLVSDTDIETIVGHKLFSEQSGEPDEEPVEPGEAVIIRGDRMYWESRADTPSDETAPAPRPPHEAWRWRREPLLSPIFTNAGSFVAGVLVTLLAQLLGARTGNKPISGGHAPLLG